MPTTTKARLAPAIAADSVAVGERGIAILERMRQISEVEKAARDLKNEKTALQDELNALTNGAKYATFQGVKVATRIDSHSVLTDLPGLLQGWPEAYAAIVSKRAYSYYRQ